MSQPRKIFLVDTDARWYAKTAEFVVAPSIYYRDDDLGPVFAPAPIPEPHTVALLAAGLMALGVGSRLRAARG